MRTPNSAAKAAFYRFEPTIGKQPKCKVTDANGEKWTVKFGEEVHPDVAAPRLAWALGYEVEESYYLKSGKIEGIDTTTDRGRCKPYSALTAVCVCPFQRA